MDMDGCSSVKATPSTVYCAENKPWLEKSDSCYDSDDHEEENADANIARSSRSSDYSHLDVSRTVSETLKEEYDSVVEKPNPKSISNSEFYNVHLAFALKLGYCEAQVQKALQKHGGQVTQNEFLAELIRLGATDYTEEENETEDNEASHSQTETVCPAATVSSSPRREPTAMLGVPAGMGQKQQYGDLPSTLVSHQSACDPTSQLRHIVIDGSNVAMSHGNKILFSCRGIQLCVDFFKQRGHREITVFVPQWRKESSKPDAPIKDQEILLQLERDGVLTFTPSRYVGKRRLVCYDDRYVIKLAMETDGIIVSNDTYRDLIQENADYRTTVEERLLMYSFVNDRFMPPDDPLGRHGPTLKHFLRKNSKKQSESQSRPCPYGKKCTYGNKCKFAHPERGSQPQKSVAEVIGEKAKIQLQEIKDREVTYAIQNGKNRLTATVSSPVPRSPTHKPIVRTRSMVPGGGGAFPFDKIGVDTHRSPSRFFRNPSPTPTYRHSSVDSIEHMASNLDHMYPRTSREDSVSKQNTHLYGMSSGYAPRQFFQGFSDVRNPSGLNKQNAGNPLLGGDLNRTHQHQSLVQTFSDGGGARIHQENAHSKLQRQLSLNPYAEHQQQFFGGVAQRNVNPIARQGTADPSFRNQEGTGMGDFHVPSNRSFFPTSHPFSTSGPDPPADTFFSHRVISPPTFFPSQHSSAFRPAMSSSQMEASLPDQSRHSMSENVSHLRQVPVPTNMEAQRANVYSRLTTLFPEEQVRTVMTCYPMEHNLHKLCSAILTMFPEGRLV